MTEQSEWYDKGYQRGYKGAPYEPPKDDPDALEQFEAGYRDGSARYEREWLESHRDYDNG